MPKHSSTLDYTERFWDRVRFTDSCWLWTSTIDTIGYGRFNLRGGYSYAHRWAYEFCVGKIPSHLQIDHLCRIRHCVNPGHLEAVTVGQNVLRGVGITAAQARQTHCKRGHEFNEENTYVKPQGGRVCRTCKVAWNRKQRSC